MSAVILSPKTYQVMKNATSDGIVMIAPMIEPFRNISFVEKGLIFLSMRCGSVPVIKIDLQPALSDYL
jgi:hypothetical protein